VVLAALATHADDERMLEKLRRSDGLCNDHFEAALRLTGRSRRLAEAQLAARTVLIDQVDELIRKQDYRFGAEPAGAEVDSWLRAVAAISGLEPAELPRRRSAKLPPSKRDERLP
jgi:hypothetical protein